jgi:hypothetical protein
MYINSKVCVCGVKIYCISLLWVFGIILIVSSLFLSIYIYVDILQVYQFMMNFVMTVEKSFFVMVT